MSGTQPNRRPTARKPTKRRRSGVWLITGVATFVALVVAGAVSGGDGTSPGSVTERDPEVVAAGEELFQANCASCHGPDLEGTDTGPPFLNAIYAPNHHADEAFLRAVELGVQAHHWNFGPMPPVDGLERDDITKIVAFVRSQQEAAGVFRDPTHP